MHNYRVKWLASELSKMIWVIYEYDMSDLWTMNWVNAWSQYNIKNKNLCEQLKYLNKCLVKTDWNHDELLT